MYPALCAILIASRVSETEPIWLSLIRIEFPHPRSIPFFRRSVLVTNKSSPTSCTFPPSSLVRSCQPSQSSSSRASSIEMIGYFSTSCFQCWIRLSEVNLVPAFGRMYSPFFSPFHSLEAASMASMKSLPGSYPAFSLLHHLRGSVQNHLHLLRK